MTRVYANSEGLRQQHAYWNANEANVVIVAREGRASDYAAYIGALHYAQTEQNAVEWVLKHGDKIDPSMAELLFPEFKAFGLEYRL